MFHIVKRLKNLKKRLSGSAATKSVSPDIYIISFPKCGRTWLRVMLGRIYQLKFNQKELELFDDLTKVKRGFRVLFTHDDEPFWKKPNELKSSKDEYKGKNVIFLYRDPRDVLISSYFEKSKRLKFYDYSSRPDMKKYKERIVPFEGTIHDYLNHEVGGFETILRYFNIWSECKHVPKKYLAISYEDMTSNPKESLKEILKFLELESTETQIEDAIQFASFENMKNLESNSGFNSSRLQPADKNDGESYKVRRGKVSGYVDYLSQEEIGSLAQKMIQTLNGEYEYK